VTPKGQRRDPNTLRAQYLEIEFSKTAGKQLFSNEVKSAVRQYGRLS